MTGKSKIEGVDDSGLGNNRGVTIIKGGVYLSIAGEGVGGSELSTREDFPGDVEVL